MWRLACNVGAARFESSRGASAELRRDVHSLIDQVTHLIAARRLNVAIARLMELTSLPRRAVDGPADRAVHEGTSALVRMLSCVAPFTAEDAWQRLGEPPSVAEQPWPGRTSATSSSDHLGW